MYYRYGKCSKILDAFLLLFSKLMIVNRACIHSILVKSKQGRPWSDCIFRKLVFEILELLPYSEYLVELNM